MDLHFGYDPQMVHNLFEGYGSQGRELYADNLAIDSFMPLFLAQATVLFTAMAFGGSFFGRFLLFIPIAFLVADWVENILLFLLLNAYPALDPGLVKISSNITRPKLIAAIGTYALLVISGIVIDSRYAKSLWSERLLNRQAQ